MLEISRVVVDSEVANSPIWLDDGRIAIGAAKSSQGGYRRGAIWLYPPYHSGSLHQPSTFILPPIPEIRTLSGAFGEQLASSGPWLAATARLTNDSHTVCLFEATSATEWTFRTNLLGNAAASEDRFGDGDRAISMHGRWLAVIRYESSGRVHLYRVNDQGVWEERQQLTIPGFENIAINDNTLLAMHDRTLAIGVPRNGNSSFTGRVDVWRLDQSEVWNFETNLVPASVASDDRFGTSLALGPDKIFASAIHSDLITNNAGAIYLFERQNGLWTEVTQIASLKVSTLKPMGEHIAYSRLGGEFLVDGSNNRIRMFQPTGNGASWQQVSIGHPGRVFRDWESPAGTVKTYSYNATNTPVYSIAVRAHQVLVGFAGNSGFTMLFEHGWHSIEARNFSIDPPCSTRPVSYVPIGAPRDDGD
jgi:hypothetical protein